MCNPIKLREQFLIKKMCISDFLDKDQSKQSLQDKIPAVLW